MKRETSFANLVAEAESLFAADAARGEDINRFVIGALAGRLADANRELNDRDDEPREMRENDALDWQGK